MKRSKYLHFQDLACFDDDEVLKALGSVDLKLGIFVDEHEADHGGEERDQGLLGLMVLAVLDEGGRQAHDGLVRKE